MASFQSSVVMAGDVGVTLKSLRTKTQQKPGYFGIEAFDSSSGQVFGLVSVVYGHIPFTWVIQTKIDW